MVSDKHCRANNAYYSLIIGLFFRFYAGYNLKMRSPIELKSMPGTDRRPVAYRSTLLPINFGDYISSYYQKLQIENQQTMF